MVLFQSPYPDFKSTLQLPDPEFGDTVRHGHQAITKRTLGNGLWVFVRKGQKVYKYQFVLQDGKYRELVAFYQRYAGVRMMMTTHDGEQVIGVILNNPLDGETLGRMDYCEHKEAVSVTLEFASAV